MDPMSDGGLEPLARFSSEPAEVVGRVLDRRFRVERVLGQGAMAVVLGARHLHLGTPVALKVLHPMLAAVPEMRARFLREARLGHAVAHPGLVRVSDVGVSAEGLHYLVMEQLTGVDLLTWSERRGPASVRECAEVALAVCEVLAALHAAGYVHRDLKPENLWVVAPEEGAPLVVKVLDLGIAGLVESAHDERLGRGARSTGARLTRAGETLGTALYMSPEQAMGKALDGRSDLYALGALLWELATAKTAFEGDTAMAIMLQQIGTLPPAPSTLNPDLPAWFDRVVMKLLAKKPEERFQSAAELRAALEAGSGEEPEARTDASERPETRARGGVKRHHLAAAAVAASVIAAVALTWPAAPARESVRRVARGVSAVHRAPTIPSWLASHALGSEEREAAAGVEVEAAATAGGVAAGRERSTDAAPNERAARPIALRFAVEPRGARVLRDGALVGMSPFLHEVEASDARVRYTLEAPGRIAQTIEVTHDRDQVIAPTLVRAGGRPGPRDARGDDASATNEPGDGLWQPERPAARDTSP